MPNTLSNTLPNYRVLVADDEPVVRGLMTSVLRNGGHEPLEAADGAEALGLLAKSPVDLMLLDVQMPGMDGLRVLQEARQRDPNLRVIVVTGHGNINDAITAIKKGASDYLTKPFAVADLLGAVQRALESRPGREAVDGPSIPATKAAPAQPALVETPLVKRVLGQTLEYLRGGVSVILRGPSGSGKTSLAEAMAQRLGRPVLWLAAGKVLAGRSSLPPSDEQSGPGENACLPMLDRARSQGYTLICDDFDRCPAERKAELASRLLHASVGDSPPPHPGFHVLLTGAMPGMGEKVLSNKEGGVVTVWLEPLDQQTEAAVTAARSGLPLEAATKVVRSCAGGIT